MFGNIFFDMFNSITDGVYYINSKGTIEHWNKGAEILGGLTLKDARGKRCDEVLHYEDAPGHRMPAYDYPANLCLKSSRTVIKDVVFLRKDSEKRFIEEHASPVFHDGKVVG